MKSNQKFAKVGNKLAQIIVTVILTSIIINIVSAETTLEQDVASFGKTALGKLSGQSNSRGTGNDPIQGTGKLVDFYNRNQSLIDFFVMFTLFATVALVGLNKVGFGESGNAMKGLALAVGAALALAALKAGYSPSFFVPFVKNFLFLIIFFIIFWVIKASIGEHTVVAFILALVITWVAFNVVNLVMEPGQNKFDMANLFKLMADTPTDTAEQRRLSNVEVRQIQDELDALYEEKGRLEGLINDGVYKSKFLVKQAREKEKDKEKKDNLMRLFDVMEKIEELEGKMQREMGKRFDYDKQSPTTPKVYLKIKDDKTMLICTIDPTTGKILGAPENVNKDIKYRFEFSVDGAVEKYYDIDYKDRVAGQKHPLAKEGTWKCKVYAYIETYGKTPDQVTPGEATIDYLDKEFKADEDTFKANRDIIKTERENIGIINDAVTALKGLEKRTHYNRNKIEIDKFINAGNIKKGVIAKFKEAKNIEAGLSAITDPAQKAQKIGEMVQKAKEALNDPVKGWEAYQKIDIELYNSIKSLIDRYSISIAGSTASDASVSASGLINPRALKWSDGVTRTLQDGDDSLIYQGKNILKGDYQIIYSVKPQERSLNKKVGSEITFSVTIDSAVKNQFLIVVTPTIEEETQREEKVLVDDNFVQKDFAVRVRHKSDPRTVKIEIFDMDHDTKDDLITDAIYTINIEGTDVYNPAELNTPQ